MIKKWMAISKSWKAGFTLVELVIAIGIMAFAGGALFAGSRGIQRRTLNNASLALQADIRRVQRMALIEGRRWRIQFYKDFNRYSIHSVPRSLAEHIYTVYLPRGVEIDFLTHHHLDYLPRGTVSSGFSIHLRSRQYVQRLTATVSAGRIAIFEIEQIIPRSENKFAFSPSSSYPQLKVKTLIKTYTY